MDNMSRALFLKSAVSAAALVLGCSAATAQAYIYTSTTTPVTICDMCTVSDSVNVPPGLGLITDVDVNFDAYHSFTNDLYVWLSNGSQSATLFSHVNGGNNLTGVYYFDDDAIGDFTTSASAPGTYHTQSGAALDVFDGLDPTGTWTLTFADQVGADSGTLYAWNLILTVQAVDQAIIGPVIGDIVAGDNRALIGTLADRATANYGGGIEPAADVANPFTAGGMGGIWMRGYAGQAKGDGNVDNLFIPETAAYEEDLWFLQGGASYVLSNSADSKIIGSLFAHYMNSDADVSDSGGGVGDIASKGYGGGAALTWMAGNGAYVDLLGQATKQELDVVTITGAEGSTDALVLAGSIEAGLSYGLGGGVSLVPQAQLVYQNIAIDGFTDSAAQTYEFDNTDSLEGRAGIGLAYSEVISTGHRAGGDVTASIVHEFMGDAEAIINGNTLGYGGEAGTAADIAAGFSVMPASTGMNFGFRANYRVPFKDGQRESFAAQATLGWSW
jgi:outer membrane autotransporter protein